MAIVTDDRSVRTRERESALLMQCELKRRWREAVLGVAVLAAIEIWSTGKLFGVRIGVAVLARAMRHTILHNLIDRRVTLFARNRRVLLDQLIFNLLVCCNVKRSRLKTLFVVARRAFSFVGTRIELAFMRVVAFVAVHTKSVSYRLLKIGSGMAF